MRIITLSRILRLLVTVTIICLAFNHTTGTEAVDDIRIDRLNHLPMKRSEVDLIPGRGKGKDLLGALGFVVSDEGDAARLYRLVFPTVFRMGALAYQSSLPDIDVAEFGTVQPFASEAYSVTHTSDWTTGVLTYTYGAGETMTVYASRLSPAILIEYTGGELVIFGGPKMTVPAYEGSLDPVEVPGNPKYVAFGSSDSISVHAFSEVALIPPSETEWLLTWLGDDSHFLVSGIPDPMAQRNVARGVDMGDFYKGDCPFLFVFENLPSSVRTLSDGGLAMSFTQSAGYIALLPLYGDIYLSASETEGWGQTKTLPEYVVSNANWWKEHLTEYPIAAREWWSYDPAADQFSVENEFEYLKIGDEGTTGTRFAPIPPMLAIAYQEGFPIAFTDVISDSGLVTQIGPYLGIEGASGYSYSLSGLGKYVREQRVLGNGGVPQRITEELESEVAQVIANGHLAPFYDSPSYAEIPFLIWKNPGETPFYLLPALPHLGGELQQSLIDYVVGEISAYPPDKPSSPLLYDEGIRRERYDLNPRHVDRLSSKWLTMGAHHRSESYPPENLYALWLYYETINGQGLEEKWPALRDYQLFQGDNGWLNGHEWTTLGFYSKANGWWSFNRERAHGGVVDTNTNITGLIGYLRLAEMAQESDSELLSRAWGFYYKQLIKRYAEGKFVANMYQNGLLRIPPNSNWLEESSQGVLGGLLFPGKWDQPEDDIRQPYIMDEFGVFLREKNRGRWFLPFMFMTPELGRFLSDFSRPESERFISTVESFMGDWYIAYKEQNYGAEGATNYPEDSHQIFMARAWVLGEEGDQLESYIDIPWVKVGDYFYIHKLCETAEAYRGTSWSELAGQGAK